MHCFNFFRNQLWRHLLSSNSFRNVNMCLLEVAMCEKCRSSHFQSDGGGGEGWGGRGGMLGLGGVTNLGGGQYPITCHVLYEPSLPVDGENYSWRDNSPIVNNVEYIIILILLSQSMNLYTRMAHPIILQNITLTVLTSFFVSTFLKEIQIIFI